MSQQTRRITNARALALPALLLACLLLTACAPPPDPAPDATPVTALPDAPDPPPVDVALASSDAPRDLDPDVETAELETLVAGNTAFALDLYHALRPGGGNLFFSPHSLSTALAMTYAGARGETARQMAEVLHYDLPPDALHPAFNALDLRLTTPGTGDVEEGFQLEIANAAWALEGWPVQPDYLDTLAVHYGAGLRLLDFSTPEAQEASRQTINGWVADRTNGKIEDLIPEGIFNTLTRLVLTNAIYFRADWVDPFLNGTEPAPFQRLDGSEVTVEVMSRRADAPYAEGADYQAVGLPYAGGSAEMVVVMPAAGSFENFEAGLDAGRLGAILAALEPTDLKLYLPKFEFETPLDLNETLISMGMPDAFDRDRADFSGIFVPPNPPIFIRLVVHKGFVSVDELGTEAAAASGVVAEIVSMPINMRVDRPFVFVIREPRTGAILFLGRVLDPTA